MTDADEVVRLRAENAELARGIRRLRQEIEAGDARIRQLKLEADALHAEWVAGTHDRLGLPS